MGDGKSNPFGSGKSGADGNKSGGSSAGMSGHRGPERSQKMGESTTGQFDGDRPPTGDKYLKVDPPTDRKGLVGQKADDKGGMKHKPFKLGGKGPSMGGENSDSDLEGGVGDLRDEPTPDEGF
jgi:hypothetical protein